MKTIVNAAATGNQNLQAAGFFDWANNMISNTQALIGGVLVVAGLLIFIMISWAGKNIPSVIGGLVVGGIVAGAGTIIISLSGVFGETIDEGNTTAAPYSHEASITTGQSLI